MRSLFQILLLTCCAFTANAQTMRIDSMHVDEARDQLLIYGDFGSEQGEVSIDSVSMRIIRWTPYWVRCIIPRTGKGSAGPVVISSMNLSSSPALLTSVEFNVHAYAMRNDNETLGYYHGEQIADWHLSFRLDWRSYDVHEVTGHHYSGRYWFEDHWRSWDYSKVYDLRESGSSDISIRSDTQRSLLTVGLRRVAPSQFEFQLESPPDFNYGGYSSSHEPDTSYSSTWSGSHSSLSIASFILSLDTLNVATISDIQGDLTAEIGNRELPASVRAEETHVLFRPKVLPLTIGDTPSARSIAIYPNPAYDELLLSCDPSLIENRSISIFDVHGGLVRKQLASSNHIDLRGLPSGAYFLALTTASGQRSFRFVKW